MIRPIQTLFNRVNILPGNYLQQNNYLVFVYVVFVVVQKLKTVLSVISGEFPPLNATDLINDNGDSLQFIFNIWCHDLFGHVLNSCSSNRLCLGFIPKYEENISLVMHIKHISTLITVNLFNLFSLI